MSLKPSSGRSGRLRSFFQSTFSTTSGVPVPPRMHQTRSTSGSSHACSRSATRFSTAMVSYRVAGSPSRACGISLTRMPACFNRAIARSSASEEFAGQAGATRATVLICPGKIPAQANSSASFASAIDIMPPIITARLHRTQLNRKIRNMFPPFSKSRPPANHTPDRALQLFVRHTTNR